MSKLQAPSISAITGALVRSKHPYRLRDLPTFISQVKQYIKLGGRIDSFSPIMFEHTQTAGSATGHYFHQDLLVANLIHAAQPQSHLDVGSRIDGFVAHVASFMPIDVLDIRLLPSTGHSNIQFVQADLMKTIDPSWIGKYDSISCLHAIEHFGLGRYGDPLDPEGHLKGFQNLLHLLKPGGKLYISAPIAAESVVEFNAHRKFHPLDIVSWPTAGHQIKLRRFDYVDDAGNLHQNAFLLKESCKFDYGCGIYTFEKSSPPGASIVPAEKGANRSNIVAPRITFQMDPDNAEGAGSFYQRPFLAQLVAKQLQLPFINTSNRHSAVHYKREDFQEINRDWEGIFGFLGEVAELEQPCPSLDLHMPAIAGQTYHLPFDAAYEFLNSMSAQEREQLLESARESFRENLKTKCPHLIPAPQDGTIIALHLRDRSAGDPIPTRRLLPWQMFSVDYGLPDNNPRYYSKLYANAINSIVEERLIAKPILQIHSTGTEESFKQLLTLLNPQIEVQFFLNEHPPKSFVSMAYADILIASHSSFSWLPMLLHSGPKYIRKNFRHFLPANTQILEEVLLKDKSVPEQMLIKLNMRIRYWLFKRFNLVRY
jgi:hypothetical protein